MVDFQKTKTIYEEEKSILTFKIYYYYYVRRI